jgi:hypothetical protein
VLSPETVRTHVRNAMAKLGATTRSQAVVIALQRQEIPAEAAPATEGGASPAAANAGGGQAASRPADLDRRLDSMLSRLLGLYDVDAGAVLLAEDDGLSLRLAAHAETGDATPLTLPKSLALGDGSVGRAALERRAQLIQVGAAAGANGTSAQPCIVAPMVAGGRLLGVICLGVRTSRPVGRGELLLTQAFATRIGEIIAAGGQVGPRLDHALERFRASWSATNVG